MSWVATMKTLLGVMVWLLLAWVCPAAEIVAWKVPLSRYVDAGLAAKGIVRCKSAPEASPFFKDGDELWDLKRVERVGFAAPDPPFEWVVWNATSGRLVAKGEWNAIWQTYQDIGFERLPRQCRITAEVIDVPADGKPLAPNAVPLDSLTWVTRSGHDFDVSCQGKTDLIRLSGSATIGQDDTYVNVGFLATCVVRDHPRLEIRSGIAVSADSSLWVARDFDGRKGLDLRISAHVEMMDGTPLSESYMIQKGNLAKPFPGNDRTEVRKHRMENKGWLATIWMPPEEVAEFFPSNETKDPFADAEQAKNLQSVKPLWVETPDDLKPWFGTKVWDMRKLVKNMGIIAADTTDFAGYDPVSLRIFVYSKDEATLEKFALMFTPTCNLQPHLIAVTLEGTGQTRLVVSSGCKDYINRLQGKKKILRKLDVEATIGEGYDMIDLKLDYRDQANAASRQAINTAVTLQAGVPLTVLGPPAPLRARAEIVEFGDCLAERANDGDR